MKIRLCNVMIGLVGLSGHQRGGFSRMCRGVTHGDPQIAQNWAATGAFLITLKNDKKKIRKKMKKVLISGINHWSYT